MNVKVLRLSFRHADILLNQNQFDTVNLHDGQEQISGVNFIVNLVVNKSTNNKLTHNFYNKLFKKNN